MSAWEIIGGVFMGLAGLTFGVELIVLGLVSRGNNDHGSVR